MYILYIVRPPYGDDWDTYHGEVKGFQFWFTDDFDLLTSLCFYNPTRHSFLYRKKKIEHSSWQLRSRWCENGLKIVNSTLPIQEVLEIIDLSS